AVTLGLCLGWSFFVDSIDVLRSRQIRSKNALALDSLSVAIPDHSALFTYWGSDKSAAGPMQLNKDVVIVDVLADMGNDAPRLAREFRRMQRRVFMVGSAMPADIIRATAGRDSLATAMTNPFLVYELVQSQVSGDSTMKNAVSMPHPKTSTSRN
ncbi:MAG TPA: hypothetical protein VI758_05030, partial [Bacteroidota bacterium]